MSWTIQVVEQYTWNTKIASSSLTSVISFPLRQLKFLRENSPKKLFPVLEAAHHNCVYINANMGLNCYTNMGHFNVTLKSLINTFTDLV